MGQCEQLESQADASWMYEFSPMVFHPRQVLALFGLVLEKGHRQIIEEYVLIKTLLCVQFYSSGKRK